VDSCVLQTFRTYFKDNSIRRNECKLKISHNNSIYLWNTVKVLSKHLVNQVNHHETFLEYYEIFKRQGHASVSMNTFFKCCREFVILNSLLNSYLMLFKRIFCRKLFKVV